MTTNWENMMIQLAQVQAAVRQLQREMGITSMTLAQRADRWNRRQAEIAQSRVRIAPRIRFPVI